MSAYWSLQVHIPLSRSEGAFGLADELERLLGPRSGSGVSFQGGCPSRDIDWSFLSEELASEAEDKAFAYFSERVIPTNDDDSDGEPVQVDVEECNNEE